MAGSGVTTLANKSTIEKLNYTRSTQVAKELQKPIIRKFKKNNSLFCIQRQYFGCWFNWYAINKQI